MSTVTGYTKVKIDEIFDETIQSGEVDVSGHLILEKRGGGTVDAGLVKGPQGDVGPAGGIEEAPPDSGLYVRKNGDWVLYPTAPTNGKKYAFKDGGWVLADQPWKLEFTDASSFPSGFTVNDISPTTAWAAKFSGSGYTVNYNLAFIMDGTNDVDGVRFTLPTSLRPIIKDESMAYLSTFAYGSQWAGVARAGVSTAGLVTCPQVMEPMLTKSVNYGDTAETAGFDSTFQINVRMSGTFTRNTTALPDTANYV